MDAGKRFIGIVDELEDDPVDTESFEKEMGRKRRAPTENMAVPFSVYLIEEA